MLDCQRGALVGAEPLDNRNARFGGTDAGFGGLNAGSDGSGPGACFGGFIIRRRRRRLQTLCTTGSGAGVGFCPGQRAPFVSNGLGRRQRRNSDQREEGDPRLQPSLPNWASNPATSLRANRSACSIQRSRVMRPVKLPNCASSAACAL